MAIKKAARRCPAGGKLGCVAAAPGGMAAPIGYDAGGRSASRADQEGGRMQPYLVPTAELFDRAAVPS